MKAAKVVNRPIPARLWKRAVAYGIDVFALNFVLLLPLHQILPTISLQQFSWNLFAAVDRSLILLTTFIAILTLGYWVALEWKLHQSLGKMFMKLYVIGQPYTFQQILLRNLTKPFSLLFLIDVLYLLFKGGHQRLFEVFSNTQVVEFTWSIR